MTVPLTGARTDPARADDTPEEERGAAGRGTAALYRRDDTSAETKVVTNRETRMVFVMTDTLTWSRSQHGTTERPETDGTFLTEERGNRTENHGTAET